MTAQLISDRVRELLKSSVTPLTAEQIATRLEVRIERVKPVIGYLHRNGLLSRTKVERAKRRRGPVGIWAYSLCIQK